MSPTGLIRRAHIPNPTLGVWEVIFSLAAPLNVDAAERRIADLMRVPEAVLFASARGALAAAVAELAKGETVAIPAYTCAAVANALISAGSVPRYVDVDERGLVPGGSWPSALLVVTQDTYGFAADAPHDSVFIRDAAHRPLIGADSGAAVTITSFEHSKWLSAGQGGLAVTSDRELSAALRRRRDQAARPKGRWRHGLVTGLTLLTGRLEYAGRPGARGLLRRVMFKLGKDRLAGQSTSELAGNGVDPGLLGRPNTSSVRLMTSQLAKAPTISEHRSRIVAIYDRAAGVERPAEALVRYPMSVADPVALETRFLEEGWDVRGRWFSSPLHPAGTDLARLGYELGSAPGAEKLTKTVVNLPTHPCVDEDDASFLIALALQEGAQPLA